MGVIIGKHDCKKLCFLDKFFGVANLVRAAIKMVSETLTFKQYNK